MNIIVCENNKKLAYILQYIKLEEFIFVSSLLDVKVLADHNTINIVIYENSINVDIKYFKKNIKRMMSFDEFINQVMKLQNNQIESTKPIPIKPIPLLNNSTVNNIKNPSENIAKNNIQVNTIKSNALMIHPKAKKYNSTKIFTFTSVKGGVGVSSLIVELSKLKMKKLILDLSFIDGGSDLSYYLNLPRVPHIGTYLKDLPDKNALLNNVLQINNNTQILQAPSSRKIYSAITRDHIDDLLTQNIGNILIDIPFHSQYISDVLQHTTKLYIVTTASPMEVNRINDMFDKYKSIITCIVINAKNNKYSDYFEEYGLSYISYKQFIKEFAKI